jgi:ubiquinone/menaquinone biosynthesis C-methylase UbiE
MKKLEGYGVAHIKYKDAEHAKSYTYDTVNLTFPSTILTFKDNPYNKEVLKAKNILDYGCGVGRNLKWIMENTKAHYYGIDTNEDMLKYFWETNKDLIKYKDRVTIGKDFSILDKKIDLVVITFVFQHFTYRVPEGVMNIDDITKEIKKHCTKVSTWIMLEHDSEDIGWQQKWMTNCSIKPDVYITNYTVKGVCHQEELCHRGNHNLIIFKV